MSTTNFFSEQTKLVADYFDQWHNAFKSKTGDRGERSRYCQLFDVFEDREKAELINKGVKEKDIPTFHNCIGCNFEEGCINVFDFLREFQGTKKIRTYLTIYTLLFYTLAERLAVVYQELGVVNGKQFDWQQFPVLRNIKHWANFFKHPKAYMFLHHPDYYLENDPDRPNSMINAEIDSAFVDSFYRAGADNNQLRILFENKKDWNIIFPDLLQITKDLCNEVDKACDFIVQPTNVEVLRTFTLKDY